jgi:glycogen operon protein
LWTEWNGKYRDTVRRFWRGDGDAVSEFATRLCGSSDLYEHNGRKPYASINFVTSHDGFCLNDLVSYNHKHNEANQEGNNDGDNHNLSWNCGIEGPTDDPRILALRQRHMRNFMATLLLSQGVPMIRSGDEICHTQNGNNNAYCQDNELSWPNWDLDESQRQHLDFLCRMVRLRREQPVLIRRQFLQGRQIRGGASSDLIWLRSDGCEMGDADWNASRAGVLGVRLNGKMIDEVDERGHTISGSTLLLLFNAEDREVEFTLPETPEGKYWRPIVDTALPKPHAAKLPGGSRYELVDRSLVILVLRRFRSKLLARWRASKTARRNKKAASTA